MAGSEPPPSGPERPGYLEYREFADRRTGMIHAMDGGLWLHRHVWLGRPMAHLVSTDRERLLAYGRAAGLPAYRLQHKPLKDPRTGERREAWHWDLVREFLPPPSPDGRGGPVRPEFDFSADGARAAAEAGRLEAWVHAYLTAGYWANHALSEGLKRRARWWAGPVEIPVGALERCCGPEPGMEFPVDPAGWEEKVSTMARSIYHPRYLPPLIAQYRSGALSVRDGSHRLEALRRAGWPTAWVIVWFDSAAERESWRETADC